MKKENKNRTDFIYRGILFKNAPKKRGRFMGVYMIGDFYIGASTHILSRISGRYREYLRDVKCALRNGYKEDYLKCYDIFWYFRECEIKGVTPVVRILCDNPLQEIRFKNKYNIPLKKNEKCFHEDKRFILIYEKHIMRLDSNKLSKK